MSCFSKNMPQNDTCLGNLNKEKSPFFFFFEKYAPKNASIPQMSRIDVRVRFTEEIKTTIMNTLTLVTKGK